MKENSLYALIKTIEALALEIEERDLLEAQARDIKSLNEAIAKGKGEEDKAIKNIEERILARRGYLQKIEISREFSDRKQEFIQKARTINYKEKQ